MDCNVTIQFCGAEIGLHIYIDIFLLLMIIRHSFRRLLAIFCSLIFSVLVFIIAALLGFGTDVGLFSLKTILVKSLMFLLVPTLIGIFVSYKLSPKHLYAWMVVIVFPFPFGFLVGSIPESPTIQQLAVLTCPVLFGVFLLVIYLKKVEKQ